MQAAQQDIKEEFTTVLFERGNTRTCLRVIKCTNQQGVTSTKFGISEYWFCTPLDKWLPSKKHHVFLPIDRWSTLTNFSNVIEGFGTPKHDAVGHSLAGGEPSVPAASVVGVGEPAADGKRRRGRPPKSANEPATSSTTTIVQGASAGDQGAKKARIIVVVKKGTGSGSKKCEEGEVRSAGGLLTARSAEVGNKRQVDGHDAVELEAANLAAGELTGEATFG